MIRKDDNIINQIAQYFDVDRKRVELIPVYTGIRFKIDRDTVGSADINKKGMIKNIRTDNISNYYVKGVTV